MVRKRNDRSLGVWMNGELTGTWTPGRVHCFRYADSLDIRRRLQSQFHTPSLRAFELLKEIGKDCVGAVQLLPKGVVPINPRAITGHDVVDGEMENQFKRRIIPTRIIVEEEGFRISLAGVQEKTAFLRYKEQWMIPEDPSPTNHIFKLPLGKIGTGEYDMTTSVENEWLCSRILHHYRIPIASCEIGLFGREKALVVERFDRRFSRDGKELIRLPQEDF